MKHLRKFFWGLVGVLILGGLVVTLALAFGKGGRDVPTAQSAYPPPLPTSFSLPTSSPAPTATATPIVLDNGWYLYTDKEAGYSLSYPPDVHLHTSKEGGLDYKTVHIQFAIPNAGYQGMTINVLDNAQKLPIENIVQDVYTRMGEEQPTKNIQSSMESIMIGKISAIKSDFQPSIVEFTIYIPYGNKVLYAAPVTRMGLTAFDPKAAELFEEILATLTLEP